MATLILSVDDEPLIAEFLRRMLGNVIGAQVEHAETNREALAAVTRRRPDLVVSDIARPGGVGTELFDALRRDPKTASIPFVFLSGLIYGNPELELELYRRGAEGVLPKPLGTEDVLSCVKRILREPLSPDADLLLAGVESRDLDYKEDIDLESKLGRASLAKDVLAMANIGGGVIIIGVREPSPGIFENSGLPEDRWSAFETTRVNDSLRAYLGSSITVSSRIMEHRGRRFAILRAPDSGDSLALAVQGHEGAALFTGRIYSRTDAARTEEVRDSLAVLRLIDRLVGVRLRRILAGREESRPTNGCT